MRMNLLLGFVALAFGLAPDLGAAELGVVNLRCEYQKDPLGIDTAAPRLSWQIAGDRRGIRQTAYRILVSSQDSGDGDLWDSGKVASGQSLHVRYAGKPLQSFQQCFWKVQVWTDAATNSSEQATWTMGLLPDDPWQAKWIAAPIPNGSSLEGATWIWTPEQPDGLMHPPGTRYFRWKVQIPVDAQADRATIAMTADNRFELYVNGEPAGSGSSWSSLEQFDLTEHLRPGDNLVAIAVTNGGTGPNEAGLIGRLDVHLASGTWITSVLDGSALTAVAAEDGWTTIGLDDSAWKPARVLGKVGMEPWGEPVAAPPALPLFRREFTVAQPVKQATVLVCGLGFHELRLNGRKVGTGELEPGWTNYRKTCLYSVYDVTGLLQTGSNAVGVMLGNGMYNVAGGRYTKFRGTFGQPKLILELRIQYADGTVETIASNSAWKSAPGPIRFSCIFGGEDYDARSEAKGWDQPGLDDSQWAPALEVDGPGGALTSQSAPPIRVMEEFQPLRITEPQPGVFVYDLGQNFSGWPRITVSGPAGATVKLVPGELLDQSGLVTQRSSGGPMWFSYTLKGQGEEVWSPRFSYYGFRYVQVEGALPQQDPKQAPDLPRILEMKGQFLYPATEPVGRFTCSSPDVDRVHALILAAIKSNFKSVLTDCPHREKLGWLECTHLLAGCFMYNFDCARFYEKIARDMRQAQLDNGLVPDIAPEFTVFQGGFRDSPEWGSAVLISPWRSYRMYGDPEILRATYENMKRYVAYLGSRADGHIVSHGLGDWYDIGPGSPGPSKLTSLGLTATAVYYQDIEILRQTAALLGRDDDGRTYSQLAEEVKAAFNAKFFHAEQSQYDRNSQTASAMPLVLDLVPPDRRAAVLAAMVDNIRASGNRVTAGDVGFYYLVQALLDGGRSDCLYDMLCQTGGPGYMYQLQKGATSLTEAWDTNPGSSQNHCMLGHIEEWFYSGLLGIRPLAPGFQQILINPQMPFGLTSAEGHFDCLYGRIASRWKREGETLTMEVTIPPNTTATIHVPVADAARLTESGKPLHQAQGVRLLPGRNGTTVLEVGSGSYRFESNGSRPPA